MKDVVNEIKKIRWTEPKKLVKTSLLTVGIIVFTCVVFIGYDAILGKIIELIYN